MGAIKALLIINTVGLLLIMVAITGILKRQNESTVTYQQTYEVPPATWEI